VSEGVSNTRSAIWFCWDLFIYLFI
jgi:hypothetical protein